MIRRIDHLAELDDGKLSVVYDGKWMMMTLPELLKGKFGLKTAHVDLVIALMTEWGSRLADIETASSQEEALRSLPRCSGHWTEQGNGIVYITHGTGESCPVHGEPKDQYDRIRAYIGKRDEKQGEAKEAMANWAAWLAAVDDLKQAKVSAMRMEGDITRAGGNQGRLLS